MNAILVKMTALLSLLLAACATTPSATAAAALRGEAEAFMANYAAELIAGERAGIAARYDRAGAWRAGDGEAVLDSWDRIQALYASARWQPPAAFEWRDLAYEIAGPDAVVVVGRFAWTPAPGRAPLVFSYTALLVRRDGVLRIRLENESTGG